MLGGRLVSQGLEKTREAHRGGRKMGCAPGVDKSS